jgi:hypothetical protein
MATKAKARASASEGATINDSWLTPPVTTEERLVRIRALGQRINGHIQFMGTVGTMSGTSPEAKEKAVAIFYERLFAFEKELGRIEEELRLG